MGSLFAKDVPALRGPVVDQAGLLSPKVRSALARTLFDIKNQTTNEIVVLTVDSLEGENIDGYSIKVVDQWKLGQEGKDNGVLMLIAAKERKMRIEVGRGLEGVLPDITTGRIIRSMRPHFKNGDYKSGIILGLTQIIEKTGGTLHNAPRAKQRRSGRGSSGLLIIVVIILLLLFRGGSAGGLLAGLLLGSSMGRGGYSSRGGSGYSGGSFGSGGGFSGGGASGDW